MTTSDNDPSEDLARELRHRLGGEFRAEAEEGERLAELARLRGRDLAAVAAELCDRGDRVRITTGGRTFTGVVVGAGRDRCTLGTPAGTVEIRLGGRPVQLSVVEPQAVEPPPRPSSSTTFRARLRELEMQAASVEVGTDGRTEPLRGRLLAVAGDHLLIEGTEGGRIYLGWEGIAYVLRRDDQ